MKDVKEALLGRTSVRRYEREAIPQETMDFIYRAVENTPTSYNGQQFSVIDISDQALKEELYALTNQKQLKTCNRLLIFCSDYNKISMLARRKGVDFPPFTDTMDAVTIGIIDASLAMMSAVTAACSRGLGTCCIGYARTAAPDDISALLQLPPHVYLVCGMAIGIPREIPDLKPKQPQSLIIHHDTYRRDNMAPDLLAYDAEVTRYNATRSGTQTQNDWVNHMLGYYREAMNYTMLTALRHRGFDPRK